MFLFYHLRMIYSYLCVHICSLHIHRLYSFNINCSCFHMRTDYITTYF
nr:MAG TPA_asm: hypothetical protein [Caudoviricetes sp.]DAL61279.1 MAG TPA_asm: hypothetical protein [Bacteriophage sp.]